MNRAERKLKERAGPAAVPSILTLTCVDRCSCRTDPHTRRGRRCGRERESSRTKPINVPTPSGSCAHEISHDVREKKG